MVPRDYTKIIHVDIVDKKLVVIAQGSGEVLLIIPISYEVLGIYTRTLNTTYTIDTQYWNNEVVGVRVELYVNNIACVEIPLKVTGKNLEFNVKTRGYLEVLGGKHTHGFNELFNRIARLFFAYLIIPATYITILLSITYSLARVIGGMYPRVPLRGV